MKTEFALIVIFILFGTRLQTNFAKIFTVDFVGNTTIFDDA